MNTGGPTTSRRLAGDLQIEAGAVGIHSRRLDLLHLGCRELIDRLRHATTPDLPTSISAVRHELQRITRRQFTPRGYRLSMRVLFERLRTSGEQEFGGGPGSQRLFSSVHYRSAPSIAGADGSITTPGSTLSTPKTSSTRHLNSRRLAPHVSRNRPPSLTRCSHRASAKSGGFSITSSFGKTLGPLARNARTLFDSRRAFLRSSPGL